MKKSGARKSNTIMLNDLKSNSMVNHASNDLSKCTVEFKSPKIDDSELNEKKITQN